MKRIWKHKWLVIAGSAAIFLSIAAVAWAASGNDTATGGSTAVVAADSGSTVTSVAGDAGAQATVAKLKDALKQRMGQFMKRQEALLQQLRAKMSPGDQALLDQLVAKAKDQRDALRQARQNLADTLKQLRDLRNKYLDATTTTTN